MELLPVHKLKIKAIVHKAINDTSIYNVDSEYVETLRRLMYLKEAPKSDIELIDYLYECPRRLNNE